MLSQISKHIARPALMLGLFGLLPSAAFAQGLVDYALIIVVAGGSSANHDYEVCVFNLFPLLALFGLFALGPEGSKIV